MTVAVGIGAAALAVLAPLVIGSGAGGSSAPDARSEATSAAHTAERLRAYLGEERWRDAVATVAELDPDVEPPPDLEAAVAEVWLRAGELERAESIARRLAEGEAPPPRALVVLGRLLAAKGELERAVEVMDRARVAAPEDVEVQYWVAAVQADRAAAVAALERYLAIGDGDDPDRLEGARGTLRLYRALGDREVWVPESRPERFEVRLRPLTDPAGLRGYGVPVRLGDVSKPVVLQLDTGSPGLYVTPRIAARRGMTPLARETAFGGGGDGRHRADRGVVSRFDVGGLAFRDVLLATSPGSLSGIRGLVGLGPFDGYRVEIDLATNRLRASLAPERPEPGGEPYWSFGGQIVVRVTAGSDAAGLFLLDTGATRSLVDLVFAEQARARVAGRSRVVGFGGARSEARVVDRLILRFAGAATDGRPLNGVDLSMRSRLTGVEVSGFLGLDALDGRRIVFDTRHRRVYIDPSAPAD